MSIAIVYFSLSGNVGYAADRISGLTGGDLIKLTPSQSYPDSGFKKFFWGGKSAVMAESPELTPYAFNADAYDTVVFGTPVWAGTFAPPLRTFISENKAALSGKRIAVFACSSGGSALKAFDKIQKILDLDSFTAMLSLIDPKVKQSNDNEEKIADFCRAITE